MTTPNNKKSNNKINRRNRNNKERNNGNNECITLRTYHSNDNMFGLAAGLYETYLAPPEVNVLILGSESTGKTALMERMKVMQYRSTISKNEKFNAHHRVPCSSQSTTTVTPTRKNKKMLPLHKIRPTVGMNIGKVDAFGCKCVFWDVGGQMRPLWERYYTECHAVIFVIDSMKCRYMCGTDMEQDRESKDYIRSCRELFESVWNDKRLRKRNVPFMVFATKRDFEEGDGGLGMREINGDNDDESDITLDNGDQIDDDADSWLDLIDIEKLILTGAAGMPEVEQISKDRKSRQQSTMKVFGGSAKTGDGVNDAIQWLTEILKLRFHQSRRHSL